MRHIDSPRRRYADRHGIRAAVELDQGHSETTTGIVARNAIVETDIPKVLLRIIRLEIHACGRYPLSFQSTILH